MKKPFVLLLLVGGSLLLSRCKKDPGIPLPLDDQIARLGVELQTLPAVVHPASNLPNGAKTRLGKLLFWDPVLSGEKDIACGSCHHPDFGYADGLDLSIGVGGTGLGPSRTEEPGGRIPRVGRNSPTVLNTAYNGMTDHHRPYDPLMAPMFWDARVKSLEEQSLHPIMSFNEMTGTAYPVAIAPDCVVVRLAAIPEYVSRFDSAFGEGVSSVSVENMAKALASFQRSLTSTNSPFDQYARGDKSALSDQQKRGLLVFFDKANCSDCHQGPMFSDYRAVVHGAQDNPSGNFPDPGIQGSFAFRTPSLRNIELTAPYTHGGMYPTLRDALRFYNRGRSDNPEVSDGSLDPHVVPLHLPPEEIHALEAFLKALTDRDFDKIIPDAVPSGLKPGGNI